MSMPISYGQGGDAQAIKRVAETYYGGYRNLFDAHGWIEQGSRMMISAPRFIVETYGSIRAFDEAHAPSDIMFPIEAIKADPPNVWLTSFYGFRPEEFGFFGFSDDSRRQSFIKRSKPGVLVVIYGTGSAPKDQLGKIVGLQQCSHQIGPAEKFTSPQEWRRKQLDPEEKHKWNFGVKAVRAWRVTPESRMFVRDFAPVSTANEAWQHIGAQGEPLKASEALNILRLDVQEVNVYGETPIVASSIGMAKQIFAPSKAGPVSQVPHVVREAEGPKHLYILQLHGDADAFLGEAARGCFIVKAGFSRSPEMRCDDHNRALPRGAFRWKVLHSGPLSHLQPYPSSAHAKVGERSMQDVLCKELGSRSLGGEFFLASKDAIASAWNAGNEAAKEFNK